MTRSFPGGRLVRRSVRILGLWVLPPFVLTLVLLLAFGAWCVSSQAGTRWLLHTVASQLDGQAVGVSGTLWDGFSVRGLSLDVSGTRVQLADLHLQVAWPELRQRRLHVQDLSAARAAVSLGPSGQAAPALEPPSEPFQFPALPVTIQIDRLALTGVDPDAAMPIGLPGGAQGPVAPGLALTLDGATLPAQLLSLSTALSLDASGAVLRLQQAQIAVDRTLLTVRGQAALQGLAAPWPFESNVQVTARGQGPESPVCIEPLLDPRAAPAANTNCQVDLALRVGGSLDAVHLRVEGNGQGLKLAADAQVYPQRAFPLGATQVSLDLPGEGSLRLSVTPQAATPEGSQAIQAQFVTRHLQLTPWLPKDVGATVLDLQGQVRASLTATQALQDLALELDFGAPSRWNGQPLSGHVGVARLARARGVLFDPQGTAPWDPLALTVSGLDLNLALGPDRVQGEGDFAAQASRLTLDARLPALKALWPGLPGGATASLTADGSIARHRATLAAGYTPDDPRKGVLGRAPVTLRLALDGGWQDGWKGRVTTLAVQHAGLAVESRGDIPLEAGPAGTWQVGRAALAIALDGEPLVQINHQASSGAAGQWATQGRVDSLVVTPARILKVQKWLGQGTADTGGVRTALSEQARRSRLEARLDWNVKFKDTLTGDIRLVRTAGDLTVPGDVPVHLGLQAASLDLALRPAGAGRSTARADLQIRTAKMGTLRVQADTPVHVTAGGGIAVRPQDVKHVRLQADSEDLAWVNLLLDGAVEVGGTVHADVQGQSRADGRWTFSGSVRGEGLRILAVDQGVRLLDGTLQAHVDGGQIVLDHLRFPAQARVTPKEWRTATWVAENPDAQNGSLDVSGNWDLYQSQGQVQIHFRRYPILQRADRYAMVTGDVAIRASLPAIAVTGKITADAGWFDLNMLNNIPSLDSDVVVLQPGKPSLPVETTPMDLSVDLTVDLGPRFYLTGYGVNSGLVGSLDLRMRAGKLTALGALRTRGGSIDTYGQHLQLRRGTVTFQGDIANPVLSIEALRTDVAVQAGVQVAGTARNPRINLVSHPDVSETEKLTWLLLGHGPDEGGADMSLLFSVGSSFLSGGEPFYKKFGLDELSMRTGELGSTGSVLPAQTVVSDLSTGASPIEQRFVVASKTLTDDLKGSLEQALSQTGTVGRLSYRLARRLQAEVTVGTVNGLALVYRWFSMD